MTTEMTTSTPEELRQIAEDAAAQARQAEAEIERRATEQAERLEQAVDAWVSDLLDRQADLDEQLRERGSAYSTDFDKAVIQDRDFTAALAAWINEAAMRYARRAIRNEVQNAQHRRTGTSTAPDIRFYDVDLVSRLEQSADRAASILGAEVAEQLIGERPIEVD
jgi:hypothetical protein